MARFSSTVYQNEFLAAGAGDVNAIVRLGVEGAGQAGAVSVPAGEVIIVDISGSMGRNDMLAAQRAAIVALQEIIDGTYFAVVAGNHQAYLAYPPVTGGQGMVRMNSRTRREAQIAVSRFRSDGGTAIGSWLNLTRQVFDSMGPNLTQRHALLLTDGTNEHETAAQLDAAISAAIGNFQCDCRGIGTSWQVRELRKISDALLGTVDIVPTADQLSAEFGKIMRTSMSRGVANATLRVWVPQGGRILFVRQVSPEVIDLTNRGVQSGAQTVDYPTGSWSDEERDYHVSVRLPARSVGQEQLAARVQFIVGGTAQTQGLVKANWSADENLTMRINPEVAHYTGQTELASAIQEGLAAKAVGDLATATTRLGRAVQLANETGNTEATSRLMKIVDVVDAPTGTIRVKSSVNRADEMALDTASTKTTRVRG